MKENLSEVVFILDRSGSMGGLESDTIGGYNQFLAKQKEVEGDAFITTVLFDDEYELLHDRVDIKKVKAITKEEYYVRGTTALFDAIGKTIDDIGDKLNTINEIERPSKVIFVIITDGMENASHLYSHKQIKKMIDHQKTKYNWEFMFLGANFDAEAFAESISISRDRAVRYEYSKAGVRDNYSALNDAVYSMRVNKEKLDESWKKKIKKDTE